MVNPSVIKREGNITKNPMKVRRKMMSSGSKLPNAIFIATNEPPQRKTAAEHATIASPLLEMERDPMTNASRIEWLTG
jgi:hypothetical protein